MELEEVVTQYSYLWDGSEDWVLSKHVHQGTRLKIKCSGKRPTVSELLAIRRLLEQQRHVPPAELRSMIKDTGELDLGNIAPARATEVVNRANDLGLHIIATDASVTSYLPINRTTKDAMLIDDDELNERVVQEMLKRGVPVIDEMP